MPAACRRRAAPLRRTTLLHPQPPELDGLPLRLEAHATARDAAVVGPGARDPVRPYRDAAAHALDLVGVPFPWRVNGRLGTRSNPRVRGPARCRPSPRARSPGSRGRERPPEPAPAPPSRSGRRKRRGSRVVSPSGPPRPRRAAAARGGAGRARDRGLQAAVLRAPQAHPEAMAFDDARRRRARPGWSGRCPARRARGGRRAGPAGGAGPGCGPRAPGARRASSRSRRRPARGRAPCRGVVAGAQDEDRGLGLAAEPPQHLEAVGSRQHQVEDEEGERRHRDLEGFFPVAHPGGLEVHRAQVLRSALPGPRRLRPAADAATPRPPAAPGWPRFLKFPLIAVGQSFLRGFQLTDAAGLAQLATI